MIRNAFSAVFVGVTGARYGVRSWLDDLRCGLAARIAGRPLLSPAAWRLADGRVMVMTAYYGATPMTASAARYLATQLQLAAEPDDDQDDDDPTAVELFPRDPKCPSAYAVALHPSAN